jgi:ankyrin repeat protein
VNQGIEINEPFNPHNATPLHLICHNGYTPIFELYLKHKDKIFFDVTTQCGLTPIHLACSEGNTEIVKLWIDNELPLDGKTFDRGLTPLHYAVANNHVEIVDLLLKSKKIDIFATSTDGLDALDYALRMKNEPMLDTIKKNGVIFISQEEISSLLNKVLSQLNQNETGSYQIFIHENFKWPKSLNEERQKTLIQHLQQLKTWPPSHLDTEKLKAKGNNIFRLREGNHRVIFSVNTETKEIKILRIKHRKNAYKDMKPKLDPSV